MNPLFKAIVVDDEPAARRLLKSMLLEYSNTVEVIGEAGNGKEALALIQQLKPDVVFLDIQMPDLTGFEVIEKSAHQPNIIFTTAYEQYAIKAFESFSIDYILKPIREERLAQSIEKLKSFGKVNQGINLTNLKEIIDQIQSPKKATALPIKIGEKIILLRFENISYLEANDKYVNVFLQDGQKYLTDQTLTALEEKLPGQFLRVQKSYIINKDIIKEVHKHFNGRFILTMDDKNRSRVTTGLTYNEAVKNAFGLI
jgi:two-component system, LytTR family, response regulator